MSSQEENTQITQKEARRKLMTSIRPNGKIRPVPRDAVNLISHDEIQPGNVLTNIHDEYIQGRYYKKESLDSWLKTNPTNPTTRQRVTSKKNYIASIDGDTGGKTIQDPDGVLVRYYGSLTEFLLDIKRVVLSQVSGAEFTFPLNTPLKNILLTVFEKKQTAEYRAIDLMIYLFGFRDATNHYLLNSAFTIKKNNNFILNLNEPISNLVVEDETANILVNFTGKVQSLNIDWPGNLMKTHRQELLRIHYWPEMKTSIFYDVFEMVKHFLINESRELEYFRAGIGTDKAVQFGRGLRNEITKLVYDKASEIIRTKNIPPNNHNNYRNYDGGSRKRRVLRKKTRKNEKKIKSQ